MKLSPADLNELAGLASLAATEAGQLIARSRPENVEHKESAVVGGASLASQVVTEIDTQAEAIILDILRPSLERFELGLLTEEQPDDQSRFTDDYFWCIDPLDGTLAFIEGTPGYSVSIALVERDGTPRIGVAYDPVEQALFLAISGVGAFRNGEPWPTESASTSEASPSDTLSVFADRSFLDAEDYDELVEALDKIAIDMGLSGVHIEATGAAVSNACRVLAHPPACYFKHPQASGGGSLWDFAATVCIFGETDAVATDIDGDPLDLNRGDSTLMNHRGVLFATDEALAERLRALRPG